MFFKKKEFSSASSPEFLIVGLGNPGEKYEYTRHNAGFLTLDRLCVEENFKINKIKYKSVIGEVNICSHKCIAMKPQTFMNNSGEAIVQALEFYKIDVSNLIVVCDDISLDCGKLRIRRKGSHGGHNGLRSICDLTGRDDFPRIKMGVGKKPHPDYDLAKWVLGKFGKEDAAKMKESAENACECIKLMVQGDTDQAMNKYNS